MFNFDILKNTHNLSHQLRHIKLFLLVQLLFLFLIFYPFSATFLACICNVEF